MKKGQEVSIGQVFDFAQYRKEAESRRKSADGEEVEFIRLPKRYFSENWAWYCGQHEVSGNCHSEDEALYMGGAHLNYQQNEDTCDLFINDNLY